MDINAHAHPLSHPSPPQTLPARLRANRDHNADHASASPSAHQQRLLRTRNARFPAKKLSISSLSSRFSQLIKANDTPLPESSAPRNQENTVYRPHRDYPSASLSGHSFGILEEITNSISGRNKTQQKRQAIPIFQDTPERALLEASPYVSPSPDRDPSSLINSPAAFDHIHDSLSGMGLREISGNARKFSPLESPPPVSSVRGRRRKSTAKSRFNSEEYIEHIERELELVKEAVYSPNSNRPWKEKLKIAKAENERLRREIVDVRSTFDAEVQKTVEHMTSIEVTLRRKIRTLEDEMDNKASTIQNLEQQHDDKRLDQSTVDTLKATIDKLETEKLNLEQDNENMSRRNEVLTQLLALSPTKSQHFELKSPVRSRNNARPISMMIPRMPSSPGPNYLSRPHSVVASPTAATSCYFSPKQGSVSTPPHSRMQDLSTESSSPSIGRSLRGSTSRRSTLNSEASLNSLAYDSQQSASEQPPNQPNPKRRTRRFLRGSTQLKPLLLPTLTSEHGVLHSASTTSPGQARHRDFSEESIDPTVTFLSKSPAQYEPELESYPFGHDSDLITQSSRQLAYQSLEGILDGQTMTGSNESVGESADWTHEPHALPIGRVDVPIEEAWVNSQQKGLDPWTYDFIQGPEDSDITILPTGLEDVADETPQAYFDLAIDSSPSPVLRRSSVEMPEPLFSPVSRQRASRNIATPKTKRRVVQSLPQMPEPMMPPVLSNTQNSRKRRKLSSSSAETDPPSSLRSPVEPARKKILAPDMATTLNTALTPSHSRKSSSSSLLLRSPGRTKSPLEILQERNIGARPLAAVTIKTIYGTLSRYTTYIKEIKRDPLALARRIIANAWHANWAMLGKLSWWVLGLFLGPSRRDHEYKAWDWEDYDGESIADRYCRRRSREVDGQHLHLLPPSQSPERHVRFDEQHASYRTRGSRSPAKPALKKKSSWGESLLLWGKFSVAIILAVGGAVVQGPGEMMRDVDERGIPSSWPHQDKPTSRRQRDVQSPAHPPFDENAFHGRSRPIDLPSSADCSRRMKGRSPSPPPSARMLLRSGQFSSSPPEASPSPAFQFGNNQVFDFSSPCRDHDWGDRGEDTLKPTRSKRASLDNLFSSPLTGGGVFLAGMREYDPESAGLVFFDPLGDVALDVEAEIVENG